MPAKAEIGKKIRMNEKIVGQFIPYDETNELKKSYISKDFFYSDSLKAYVAIQPLKVDERVVKAASESGIGLHWDDEGRIIDITYVDAKKLSQKLGAAMLSPSDYWKAYTDAIKNGNPEIVKQLRSSESTEWLDVIFEKDPEGNVFMIEHPEIIETNEGVKYEGVRKKITVPYGRPAWFNLQGNINSETGLPLHIDIKRDKRRSGIWKYWSVFKINEPVAAIRGFVTSSGTPSLDCDMPAGAKQPVLMLRECRKKLLEPAIDPELMKKADELVRSYVLTAVNRPAIQNLGEHETFYAHRSDVFDFLDKFGDDFIHSKDKEVQKTKEKFIDMLGIIRIMAKAKDDQHVVEEVDQLAQKLFGIHQEDMNFSSFSSFIHDSRERLRRGISEKKRIVFVMGHKNPDTDTAVSSLAEAYRNSLLDADSYYIPVIQGSRIPDEIQRLLGDEISDAIVLTDCQEYASALHSGHARWILVDQNVSEVQRYAVSIVDHHILSSKAQKQDISITWEMAGSATALVTQKFHGMGIDVDKNLARILYGATLMDTEDRSDKKMTYKDVLVMNDLKRISQIQSDKDFFQDLMSHLLNTDDAELLFNRDYKQDWGIFGFAVAKVKGAFSEDGEDIKTDLLNRLVDLAKKNNKDKNFPLTIVKVADYLENNETVNRERVYLIFNDYVLPQFKDTMFTFITRIIENEFKAKSPHIRQTANSVDFWGVGDQLSRKVTAPFFEPIVEAFNEYYYSPSTNLYVKREFLTIDERVQRAAHELGIELSADHEGRINNITYNEAKQLLDSLGLEMMSLSEYWKILREAEETHDEQMLKHLRSAGFVELLDTVILEGKYIIDHPQVVKTDVGYEYIGEKREVVIPEGVPGLIYPEDINEESGFPNVVQNPRQYGDKRVWRYWSPDAPLCIATRGHIFLLNQPSFDTKIHPDDALPNLGIRCCRRKVIPPTVEIVEDGQGVTAKIIRRT